MRHGIERARHRGPAARRRRDDRPVRAGAGGLRHPGQPRPPRRAGRDAARRRRARRRARRALPGGAPADLLTWLRTPGRVADPARADALEARVRRGEGAHRRGGAAVLGAAARRPVAVGARRARGSRGREGPEPLLAALEAEAAAIWTAPHRRRADVLGAEDLADARVAARAARRRVASCAGWPARTRSCSGRRTSCSRRSRRSRCASRRRSPAPIRRRRRPARPPGVLLAQPLEIRARRFRAVFVCGLQDGEFPGRPQPDPFLSDDDRRGLMVAAGLRLPLHEDVLDRERSLFYSAVSRPEDVLFLVLALVGRGGRPAGAVGVPRRRPRPVHRGPVGASAARACSRT